MAPEIRRLSDAFLRDPKEITVSRSASVATTIKEGLVLVAEHDKREALRRLIRTEKVQNALVFCNRKVDVDILYKSLTKHRFSAGALHGDMAQTLRFATLEKFKAGDLQLLVCSDVAARGIDIGGLSHVFNFDVPHHAEDYVHRIGRTGRAGLEGHAFTIAAPEDRFAVEAIEKLTGHPIPSVVVEGLDPVDWAEDDGRKRRGRRRGAAPAKKPAAAKAAPPRSASPSKGEAPKRTRSTESRPPRGRSHAGATLPGATSPGTTFPETTFPETTFPETTGQGASVGAPVHGAALPPAPRAARAPRRERREDDLGPAVVGFGAEVPAFMLLTRAAKPARRSAAAAEAKGDNP
jgi:superfamily II DNA/RNA helicase